MPDSSAEIGPRDRLTEEFVARYRAGERPSLTEYAERLPGRADEVRDLFLALVEIEQLKPVAGEYEAPRANTPAAIGEFRVLREVGRGDVRELAARGLMENGHSRG